MSELRLRRWIKRVMGHDVQWVEPSFGSEIGIPDTVLKFGFADYPVELKWWPVGKAGQLKYHLRPAQIRYHTLAARKGKRTAIMYAVPLNENNFAVIIIPGKNCKNPLCSVTELVGFEIEKPDCIYWRLRNLLANKEFWQ